MWFVVRCPFWDLFSLLGCFWLVCLLCLIGWWWWGVCVWFEVRGAGCTAFHDQVFSTLAATPNALLGVLSDSMEP